MACVIINTESSSLSPKDYQRLKQLLIRTKIPIIEFRKGDQFFQILERLGVKFAFECGYAQELDSHLSQYFEENLYRLCVGDPIYWSGADIIYWHLQQNKRAIRLSVIRLPIYQDTVATLVNEKLAILLDKFLSSYLKTDWHSRHILSAMGCQVIAKPLTTSMSSIKSVELVSNIQASLSKFHCVKVCTHSVGPLHVLKASCSEHRTYKLPAGTILKIDKYEGLIVSCQQGAVLLEIIHNHQGYLSGYELALANELQVGNLL